MLEKFIILLKEELVALKENATLEEINNLAKATVLMPQNTKSCIYGIMTGSCNSVRASELINLCSSVRVSSYGATYLNTLEFTSNKRQPYDFDVFSSLEIFLWYATEKEINNVVCFLRGCSELVPFETDKWNYMGNYDYEVALIC